MSAGSEGTGPLAKLPHWAIWALLLALTGGAILPLERLNLPATALLAAMAAGIVVQVGGGNIRLPRPPQAVAEAFLGCMIAGSITPIALTTFLAHAPLFLSVVLAIIAASTAMGWALLRLNVLPGTTAIWGLSPGAAQAMMLMAEPFGGDARLVAFMQYLRVLLVATIAPIIAGIWARPGGTAHAIVTADAPETRALITALLIAGVGLLIARRFRIAAGTILVPLAIGGSLHAAGLIQIALPDWLLQVSYAVLGWGIGLAFTLPVLRHAIKVLPQIAGAILALIGLSGLLAVILSQADGIDPLTAYLATSPGGMSSVAIIAATSHVDLAFVISLQTVRFVLVLLLGPAISRFIATRVRAS